MLKKLKFSGLFSILLVSCNFPSLDNLSFSTSNFNTSNQTTTSSNGESISQSITSNTTSNSSSSSTISSANGDSSSGDTLPEDDNKVPFSEIDTLVAQVADAKALGIENTTAIENPPAGRKMSQGDLPQNYVVKVTETYDPQVQVVNDQTLEVTFLRTTETTTNELQTGFESYIASAESVSINKLTNIPGHVVVENIPGYQFRALKDNVILSDWKADQGLSTEFLFTKATDMQRFFESTFGRKTFALSISLFNRYKNWNH
jgi:hypothetical protein